jgi:hypothetical protein
VAQPEAPRPAVSPIGVEQLGAGHEKGRSVGGLFFLRGWRYILRAVFSPVAASRIL